MKQISFKRLALTSPLLLALDNTGSALAHGQVGSLGDDPTATDLYSVLCFTEANLTTHHLLAQVKDDLPRKPPKLNIQILRSDLATPIAANSTDNIDGDDIYSPEIKAAGGNGKYLVVVDKTAAGSENYTILFHCQTAKGDHTGTLIQTKQNQ
jgi:hypothetical protein